eukprot:scaffold1472_cov100-Skeletonema_dohrnii-CCMP3373.AAC.1
MAQVGYWFSRPQSAGGAQSSWREVFWPSTAAREPRADREPSRGSSPQWYIGVEAVYDMSVPNLEDILQSPPSDLEEKFGLMTKAGGKSE